MSTPVFSMISVDLEGEPEGEVVLQQAATQTTGSTKYPPLEPEVTSSTVREDAVLYGMVVKEG